MLFFIHFGEKFMKNLLIFSLLTVGLILFMTGPAYTQETATSSITAGTDSTLISGKALFQKDCSGCHGDKGQGFAGPNLTDKFWIHGGAIKNITTSINEGVPGKGMISWKGVLSASEIGVITKYMRSLQGTNPPKAKPPEGDLFKE
jgi:cytochrome c oxidase cbb3-type subunit 3